jgi:hypothetical protein
MCLPLQDGHTPRPLHENATTNAWPQPVQSQFRAGAEVDFVLGQGEVAIEVKGTARVDDRDLRPL